MLRVHECAQKDEGIYSCRVQDKSTQAKLYISRECRHLIGPSFLCLSPNHNLKQGARVGRTRTPFPCIRDGLHGLQERHESHRISLFKFESFLSRRAPSSCANLTRQKSSNVPHCNFHRTVLFLRVASVVFAGKLIGFGSLHLAPLRVDTPGGSRHQHSCLRCNAGGCVGDS